MSTTATGDAASLTLPAAALAAVGALCATAAFVPQVAGVYTERDPAIRRRILRNHPIAWRAHVGAFALASVAVPVAVAMLAARLGGRGRAWTTASAVLYGAAAVAWAPGLAHRVTYPDAFAERGGDGASFPISTVGSAAGQAALGAGLLAAGRTRLGWFNLATAVGLGAVFAITRDMLPAVWYVVSLVNGVTLLRRQRR